MAATIEVNGTIAELQATYERGWFWTSSNVFLANYLNAELPPDGPSGEDPDPLGNEAARMAELLDGTLVHRDPVDFVVGRVY